MKKEYDFSKGKRGAVLHQGKKMTKGSEFENLHDVEVAARYLNDCLKSGEEAFRVGLNKVLNAHDVDAIEENPLRIKAVFKALDDIGLKMEILPKIEGTEAA